MAEMTLEELTGLLRECAGEDESVDLSGDVLDIPFDDLGYDSLAVLQTTGRIEREYGIYLSDDTAAEAGTPRLLLAFVNEALAGVPAAAV
ncbi:MULTISPECIES: acyl carrier protein [Streptomyces]|uniref:Actinorhodin polyketide synthase acyl carrier protein n=1 Tax=Streptomyces spororaveus TaxID=284039 RepID=A0ABQ3T9S4_9ACTN|nr:MULTISPECIES: acyl carrier protein [Streptomyces]MCM9082435.1 acyl carrier protein [Streptomyces spororaveus]MCX4957507.1 acyl carrier protein [Streptomyces virginiae]MCX5176249.1 acyl carrier protein [Streptomyces virginiae]MCX5302990.1 acyl carrier protein [Streptomyces sp. NBC_00160]GHI77150.1 actinorhodin polyketide synthase acyl carrier protein [Streptomyces spororaveus]